jgi:uncharacterized protein (DUF3820 family)
MVKIGKTNINKLKSGKLIMSFGKYNGEYIEDVPTDYLIFLSETGWFEEKYPRLFRKAQELIEEYENAQDRY